MMTREDMIRSIQERLETASNSEVESVYWLIEMEFESWKEVIRISNRYQKEVRAAINREVTITTIESLLPDLTNRELAMTADYIRFLRRCNID